MRALNVALLAGVATTLGACGNGVTTNGTGRFTGTGGGSEDDGSSTDGSGASMSDDGSAGIRWGVPVRQIEWAVTTMTASSCQ